MPALNWFDAFTTYQTGALPRGNWTGPSLPTLVNSGRNGKRAANWTRNAMSRGNAGNGASYFVGAYRVDTGGRVLSSNVSETTFPSNTLTTAHWLMGGMWNGFAYAGVCVSEDGALHIVRGSAFDGGPSTTAVAVMASSASGVVPIGRGWFVLEAYFLWKEAGLVVLRVNGEFVVGVLGSPLPIGDYCEWVLRQPACPLDSAAQWELAALTGMSFVMGGASRGGASLAGTQGWVGAVDALAAFTPVDENDRTGDIAVADLLVTADGATQQSAIGGDTPAATRWQSVADALTPDGAGTFVRFDTTVPKRDEYTLADLPYSSGTIYGVQPSVTLRTSYPGYAQFTLGADVGGTTDDAADVFVRSREFRQFAAPLPEKPGGGGWTVADVNAMTVRLRRSV